MLGIDEGLFAKQGIDHIDVQLAPATGPATQIVQGGKAQFGAILSVPAFVPLASKTSGLKMIGQDFPDLEEAVVAKVSSGISAPKDLVGKTVGFTAGSPQAALWPPYLKNAGLAPDSVKVANINADAQYQLLLAGRVDAIVTAAALAVPALTALNSGPLSVLQFADQGLASKPGTGIVTTDKVLSDPSNIAARFLQGASDAFKQAISDPAKAEQALDKHYPGQVSSDVYAASSKVTLAQFKSIPSTRSPVAISPEDWAQTLKVFRLAGLVKDNGGSDSAYLKQIPVQ